MIKLIAAVAQNGVIGDGKTLLWRSKQDMKHFKARTTGHSLLMGRRTYESIGGPLLNRHNYVLSDHLDARVALERPNLTVIRSRQLPEFLAEWEANDKVLYACGGTQVYEACIPHVVEIDITNVALRPETRTPVYFPIPFLYTAEVAQRFMLPAGDKWQAIAHWECVESVPFTSDPGEPDLTFSLYRRTGLTHKETARVANVDHHLV